MHLSSNTSRVDPHELELRRFIEAIFSEAVGHQAKIDFFKRDPSPFATLFPADVLTISLDGGDEISLFLKHLGSEEADHPDKQCRDREIQVYRELLTDQSLAVAKYTGSLRPAAWLTCTRTLQLRLISCGLANICSALTPATTATGRLERLLPWPNSRRNWRGRWKTF